MKKCVLFIKILLLAVTVVGCGSGYEKTEVVPNSQLELQLEMNDHSDEMEESEIVEESPLIEGESENDSAESVESVESEPEQDNSWKESKNDIVEASQVTKETIEWSDNWNYASESKIHGDSVTLYKTGSMDKKDITVAVNAGHGTKGGEAVYTFCHPDRSPKTTGGSTGEGKTQATAVSVGTTMLDGTPEANVALRLAIILKDLLLDRGYNVLMIRETDDAQIDNVARTVYANNNADCHVSIHYDSTDSDKGFFCIVVPDIVAYREMEPVASYWQEHNKLGAAIVQGASEQNVKIYGDGFMGIDLTQTSYSTIPSVDVEVGDRKSDHSESAMKMIADGIASGIAYYFEGKTDPAGQR